jgi:uncharacterized protein YndB with AHSA1/START domain
MSIAVATTASETVQIKHHYKASPAQVFAAWSDPEALNQWFGPQSHRCQVEKFEFKTGGAYQIRLTPTGESEAGCHSGSNEDAICAGKFVDINKPNRIVMSFTWIGQEEDMGETLLTIEFKPTRDGTELVLTHEKLPSEELREAHQGGWQSTLESLQEYIARS